MFWNDRRRQIGSRHRAGSDGNVTHGERIRIESSDLNNRDAAEEGLVCGGQVRVLMEAGVNRQ